MSFILDALKKSESARQDSNSPGIADVPTMQRRPGAPRWVPVVAVLLGVNLLALLYLVLRPDAAPSAQTTQTPVDRPAVTLQPAGNTTIATLATSASRRESSTVIAAQPEPQPAAEPALVVDNDVVSAADAAPNTDSYAAAAQPAPAAPPPALPTQQPEEETWLTFDDVRASGSLGLPDMHVDLHVFSDNPAERFVFINMTEYRERDTTAEGPTLRSITPEGVLLEYRGSTFLLPRD